jgi:hypothetical protein
MKIKQTNRTRAVRVERLITGYAGEAIDPANITDVLTDLRHLCDRRDYDFHDMVHSSYLHYAEERA